MRFKQAFALAAGLIASSQLFAVNTEGNDVPYFGLLGTAIFTDSARPADDGFGYQAMFGVPLSRPNYAIELQFFDNNIERTLDGDDDYQSGLMIDVVRDFGSFGWGEDSRLPTFKPFVVAGIGAVQEDILGNKDLHAGFNAGVGSLIELPWWGMAVRAEARFVAQANDDSVPGEDFLQDFRVGVGLQIPLSRFFEREMSIGDKPECKLAVVDPETGRKDCVADSDRDGVPDTLDRCPSTPLGTEVDPYGCAISVTDSDGDGVPDGRDQCPNTRAGLKVSDNGCAISQSLVLKTVTFENDSATLTGAAKSTLNEMAKTAMGQQNFVVEIAGHTDSVGSQSYNLVLSQRRAEACRNYLISQGVDANRLSAVGYGEFNPTDSNETAEGRMNNRRVEFHLVVE